MGLKAPVTGNGEANPRELPPEGNYLALCNGVYMLGTQPGYQGGEARQQVMLSFELHKRKGPAKDSQGRVLETNAIMNHTANIKSTLIEYAGALRGRSFTEEELEQLKDEGGFDSENLLSLPCRLEIEHAKKPNGDTKDKIKTISKLDPEDDTPPKPETDHVYWDWTKPGDPPKRIGYFWDRAPENPKRKAQPQAVGAGPSAGFTVPEDSPF